MKHGTICCVAMRDGFLDVAKVVSHHPEVKAVKVIVSGDEWILRETEIIQPGASEKQWPKWLQDFKATVCATKPKRKSVTTEVNKAEAARKLNLPYSRVLSICESLKALGVNLSSQ
jgi:hypothetical protein